MAIISKTGMKFIFVDICLFCLSLEARQERDDESGTIKCLGFDDALKI